MESAPYGIDPDVMDTYVKSCGEHMKTGCTCRPTRQMADSCFRLVGPNRHCVYQAALQGPEQYMYTYIPLSLYSALHLKYRYMCMNYIHVPKSSCFTHKPFSVLNKEGVPQNSILHVVKVSMRVCGLVKGPHTPYQVRH